MYGLSDSRTLFYNENPQVSMSCAIMWQLDEQSKGGATVGPIIRLLDLVEDREYFYLRHVMCSVSFDI